MAARGAEDRSVAEGVAELRRTLGPKTPRSGSSKPPIPTGLVPVDAALQGGLPRGRLVEAAGRVGRLSLCLGALAGATQQGLETAFLDPADALDARQAQNRGVVLSRLLLVRPGSAEDALRAADLLLEADGFGLVVLYLVGMAAPRRMGHAWMRLSQRAEKAGAALLVVAEEPLAGSVPVATIELRRGPAAWTDTPGGRCVLRGLEVQLHLVRNRLGAPGDAGGLGLWK